MSLPEHFQEFTLQSVLKKKRKKVHTHAYTNTSKHVEFENKSMKAINHKDFSCSEVSERIDRGEANVTSLFTQEKHASWRKTCC